MKVYLSILFIVSSMLIGSLGNSNESNKTHWLGQWVSNEREVIEGLIKDRGQITPTQVFKVKALLMARYTDCPGISGEESISSAREGWDKLVEIEGEVFNIFQNLDTIDSFYRENTPSESFRQAFTQFLANANIDESSEPLYSNETFPAILLADSLVIPVCSIPMVDKNPDISRKSWREGMENYRLTTWTWSDEQLESIKEAITEAEEILGRSNLLDFSLSAYSDDNKKFRLIVNIIHIRHSDLVRYSKLVRRSSNLD